MDTITNKRFNLGKRNTHSTVKRKEVSFSIYLFNQIQTTASEMGISANELIRQGTKREISIYDYTKMKKSNDEGG